MASLAERADGKRNLAKAWKKVVRLSLPNALATRRLPRLGLGRALPPQLDN